MVQLIRCSHKSKCAKATVEVTRSLLWQKRSIIEKPSRQVGDIRKQRPEHKTKWGFGCRMSLSWILFEIISQKPTQWPLFKFPIKASVIRNQKLHLLLQVLYHDSQENFGFEVERLLLQLVNYSSQYMSKEINLLYQGTIRVYSRRML